MSCHYLVEHLQGLLLVIFSWTTRKIKSQGRLAIDSSGHRDLKINSGTGSSQFESKGGVVGGNIGLNDLSVNCKCRLSYRAKVYNTWG